MKNSARTRLFRTCTVLLLWCVVSGLHGSGKPPATLGFTGLKAYGFEPGEAAAYGEMLRRGINSAGKYAALEFSEISVRLAEQGLPDTCFNAQCAIIAGQILGIDYFGFGSIGSVGKKSYQISMQIIEVRTGRIVSDVSRFYKGKLKDFTGIVLPQFALAISGIAVDDNQRK
jgi:hypothetical protein